MSLLAGLTTDESIKEIKIVLVVALLQKPSGIYDATVKWPLPLQPVVQKQLI